MIAHIDYDDLEGSGLARMLARFEREGTLTGDLEADAYLRASPEAALLGMLFDQRVRAETAFTGPVRLRDRLGHLDMRRLAALAPEALRVLFAQTPAVHRFTNKMADLTHKLSGVLVEEYAGSAAALWDDGVPFETIKKRLIKLPGFGPQKAFKMKFVLHYLGYRDFSGPAA